MDRADIYLAECTITKLKYVGAARHYKSNNRPWGYKRRWESHFQDAAYENKNDLNCSLFHKTMLEYGPEAFTVIKIAECHVNEMDLMEQKYIAEYNTVYPNGYNMSTGGRSTTFCEEARKNMAEGQLGKRYTHEIERKHEEDQNLPQHITPIRKNGKIIGYQVKKFPIGVDKKEYVYKCFKNINNLDEALNDATACIAELKIEYQNRLNIKNAEKASSSKAAELKLPNFIFPKDEGYFVKGLKDYAKQDIPRQDFDTIENAQEFIVKIKEFNDAKKLPFNWKIVNKSNIEELIPEFIEKSTYAKQHNGYIVQHVTGYDDKDKPIKVIKRFTDRTKSIENKYQEAITYIKDTISGS